MHPATVPLILLLSLAFASARVDAATAYKCIGADGSVGFQDQPCRPSAKQQRLNLPNDTAPTAPVDDSTPAADDAPPPSPVVQQAEPTPRSPPPDFFLCTRYDGSRYRSETGIGGASWVPLEAIQSDRDLASVYGGRNGAGVSAPGMSSPPHVTSAPGGISYVRFDEPCHRASPQEACTFLGRELDTVQDKLKRAFSDTEAQLRHDAQALREDMRGC